MLVDGGVVVRVSVVDTIDTIGDTVGVGVVTVEVLETTLEAVVVVAAV